MNHERRLPECANVENKLAIGTDETSRTPQIKKNEIQIDHPETSVDIQRLVIDWSKGRSQKCPILLRLIFSWHDPPSGKTSSKTNKTFASMTNA